MTRSSRQTDPSVTSKRAWQVSGVLLRTLQELLESPCVPLEKQEGTCVPNLQIQSLLELRYNNVTETGRDLLYQWNSVTLNEFLSAFGQDSSVPTLLESTLGDLSRDMVLVPLLRDFLQTEGTLSRDGIVGWITGSQLWTFCSQMLGGRKN